MHVEKDQDRFLQEVAVLMLIEIVRTKSAWAFAITNLIDAKTASAAAAALKEDSFPHAQRSFVKQYEKWEPKVFDDASHDVIEKLGADFEKRTGFKSGGTLFLRVDEIDAAVASVKVELDRIYDEMVAKLLTTSLGLPGTVPSWFASSSSAPTASIRRSSSNVWRVHSWSSVTVAAAPGRHTAWWTSINPAVDAMVTIDHDLSNDDMACAHFTGPDRVLLATQLVSVLNLVPVELMHLIARGPWDAPVRRHALGLLAQFYVAADGESHWDGDVEHTVEVALDDAD